MMRTIILFLMLFLVNYMIMAQKKELTADEKQVIIHKGTERPFTGKYYVLRQKGHTFASNAGLRFTVQRISLIPSADGRVLMMRFRER